MMSDELKPCPFCGGEKLDFQLSFIDGWIAHVACTSCDDMMGPTSEWKHDDKDEAKADATQIWNTRADLPATDPQAMAALGPIAPILADAVIAAEKAMQKFPQPNYVISKWAEETGEVTKALIHAAEGRETWENVRGEIVQSLAMLHRLMVEGDQVHGLPPLTALAALETE